MSKYSDLATKSTLGRCYPDTPDGYRSPFQRDRDRIIHSSAFKRLQYKTQVFINYEGDHYRNRLTHSLEVSQIARSISNQLGLNDDLTEAIALAHDLGHTPFGHAGEEELQRVLLDKDTNVTFDHNVQSFRVVTILEDRHVRFSGMNLSWETLEGLIKHNGSINISEDKYSFIKEYNDILNMAFDKQGSLESQIASISDDIAYNAHDLEDGIRAKLFSIEEVISEVPILDKLYKESKENIDMKIKRSAVLYSSLRKLINLLINDVVNMISINIGKYKLKNVDDIRNMDRVIVSFSEEINNNIDKLKSFLYNKMYKNYKVNTMMYKAKKIISELFLFFLANPECLPDKWKNKFEQSNYSVIIICDFIAGMTDRYAIKTFQNIFNVRW